MQRVQDVIRDAIVRLELPPGTAIDKAALCARLGVSRFPVSEALGRLAAEGFVEVLPQRGTRVARIDLADCRQAMFIRRALETEAMRAHRAARGCGAARRARPESARAGGARSPTRTASASTSSTSNCTKLLLGFLGFERVKTRSRPRAAASTARGCSCARRQRKASTLREHEAIVAALKRRDADAAAARHGRPSRRGDDRARRLCRAQSRRRRASRARPRPPERRASSSIVAGAYPETWNQVRRDHASLTAPLTAVVRPGWASGRDRNSRSRRGLSWNLHSSSPPSISPDPFGDMTLAPFAMTGRTEAELARAMAEHLRDGPPGLRRRGAARAAPRLPELAADRCG